MRNRSRSLAAPCLASSLLFGTLSTVAAGAAPIADLPAQAVQTNVRAVCPGIDTALQTALAPIARYSLSGSLTKVSFRLTGSTVDDVHVRTEPSWWGYRNVIRKAVRNLDCTSAPGRTQELAFLLQVTDEDLPGQPQFALLP